MKQLRWMKLDNAAKIYPAARRRGWTNVFRIAVSFKDDIDPLLLQEALDVTVKRFPSFAVRIRAGLFWYYFEEIPSAPKVLPEMECPLNRMTFSSIKKCAFRVLYHRNRISLEIFHAVADGNGAMIFAKTLSAEYARRRYNTDIPAECGVLDVTKRYEVCEIEDSFGKHTLPYVLNEKEENAYMLKGTPEPDSFLHVTTGILDAEEILKISRSHGVTLTVYLAAVMMKAIYDIQNEAVPKVSRRKNVKVLIPVDLRRIFDSKTVRNFALYITPGIDPRLGEYSFGEMLEVIKHSMGLQITKKNMAAKFSYNVRSEQTPILRIMPLFIKNLAMKLVYNCVGEKKSSICMSNLGKIELPPELEKFVTRIDFILGVQADSPCNCGILSYGGKLHINFIRNIKEPELERRFFTYLRKQGLHVYIESNNRR